MRDDEVHISKLSGAKYGSFDYIRDASVHLESVLVIMNDEYIN